MCSTYSVIRNFGKQCTYQHYHQLSDLPNNLHNKKIAKSYQVIYQQWGNIHNNTALHRANEQRYSCSSRGLGFGWPLLFAENSIIRDFHQSPSLFCILFGGSLLYCECKEATVLGLHHVGRLQLTLYLYVYLYVKCCILLLISPHVFIKNRQAIMNLQQGIVHTLICTQTWGEQACLLKKKKGKVSPTLYLQKKGLSLIKQPVAKS